MRKVSKLTVEQVKSLEKFIQTKDTKIEEAKRAQAILMLNNELEEAAIKSITGYDKKYCFKLRKRFATKGVAGLKSKGKKLKALLTKTQLSELVTILQTKKPCDVGQRGEYWSVKILVEFVETHYSVLYKSKSSYYAIFKEAKFSFHKPGKQYHEYKKELVDKWKEDHAEEINRAILDPEVEVLVEDELILLTQTTFQRVWLPRGTYPHVEVSNKRERRGIYGFLNVKSGIEHSFKTTFINSEETCNVLDKICKIYEGKKILLIWDNASWHKSAAIRQFLSQGTRQIRLCSFPPYAPEENPQEHVWKSARGQITHNKFIENIDAAADEFVAYLNMSKFNYKFFNNGVLLNC